MNVNNVSGNSGVSRSGDRPVRTESRSSSSARSSAPVDEAAISQGSRDTAASVEQLERRARAEDDDRKARVDEARARLDRGELEQQAVHEEVAKQLLRSDFLG